jgi:toxin ParE1/3/4
VKPVTFHSEADAEFRRAIAYYDAERAGLGAELQDEVEAAVLRISQNPLEFALYGKRGLRQCVVRRFPYSIFFLELDEKIWVAAVAYHKRRPNYWSRRRSE